MAQAKIVSRGFAPKGSAQPVSGVAAARHIGQAPMTSGGGYTLVNFKDEFYFQYYEPGMTEAALNNILLYFMQETIGPARLAGDPVGDRARRGPRRAAASLRLHAL